MPRKVRQKRSLEKDDKFKDEVADVDPWSTPEENIVRAPQNVDLTWLHNTTLAQNKLTRKRGVKVHKTTELPALELPHPGFSYNPSFKDHQDLLKIAVEEEKAEIKKAEKIQRAAVPKFVPEDLDLKQEELEIKEETEDEEESTIRLQPKLRKKQKRRHEREAKEQERKLREQKEKKKLESQIYRIKTFQKEIVKKEKANSQRLAKKIALKTIHEKYGQKTIGKFRFQKPSLNPALSDELAPTIREMKAAPNDSLLLDRFKSLQKRNIIEPRIKQNGKRKYKLKKFMRTVDKMDWEKNGEWNGVKLPL